MGDIPPPQSSVLTLPSHLSEKEAIFYYSGLPSGPTLVARTGIIPWKEPRGPEAYRKLRDLRTVGNHAIKEVWEDNLAFKIHALLDSMEIKWTSTDVVRLGYVGKPFAPVIVWIGVVPKSLCGDDGLVVASKCRELLEEFNITDVNVEIRESVVTRSAGPRLLESADWESDPTVDIREPLCTTLGIPICAQSTPDTEGTGGFFITEGGNTKRLLLVTARHVVFPPDRNDNKRFEHKNDSQNRHNVTLFGDDAFNKYLKSIQDKIRSKEFYVEYHGRRIGSMEGRNDPRTNRAREAAQKVLDEAKKAIPKLNTFQQDVSTRWATSESRVLGHVILSPPIGVSEGYNEDWAVVEIDASKADASNFKGNAIDLGTRIPIGEFIRMMCDNPRNIHPFEYPWDRLLRLEGTIPEEEMRYPTEFDENDEPCLIVIKRGNTTGLTVGRANDVCSYARYDFTDDKPATSKEWAILSFNSKSGAFSEEGDSGSVIVDGQGRIGGLLAGGAGKPSDFDITYATPVSFLLKRMQDNGLHAPNINPVLTA